MPQKDPRIDAYIEKAQPFAQPVLRYLREVVHDASPEIEETVKWGAPFFEYNGPLCSMAAFKQHCAFGFWKGALVVDDAPETEGAGQFGKITRIEDLPPRETLIAYVLRAMELNDSGAVTGRRKVPKPELEMPVDFEAALGENPAAREAFDSFPPSHRREYIEWIIDAKRDETRKRRIEKAVAQIAASKSLNWKYQ